MTDLKISAWKTSAYALWFLAFVLVGIAMVTELRVGQLGLLFAGLAMVINVRSFLCAMVEREKEAFNLGADSVRLLNQR